MYQSPCLYVSFFLHQSKLYAVKQSGIKYVLVEEKKFECFWLKKYSLPKINYIWASNPKQSPCGENWDLCDLIFTRVSSYLNLVWHEKLFPHQICCQAVVENVSELHWKKIWQKMCRKSREKLATYFSGHRLHPLQICRCTKTAVLPCLGTQPRKRSQISRQQQKCPKSEQKCEYVHIVHQMCAILLRREQLGGSGDWLKWTWPPGLQGMEGSIWD